MSELIKQYENICNELVKEYCKKEDCEFEFWVGDIVGPVAALTNGTFLGIEDIVFDLKNNIPKYTYLDFQEHILDWYNKDKDLVDDFKLTYESYCKGLRYDKIIENNKNK